MFFHKELNFSRIDLRIKLKVFILTTFIWISWSLGFYFFIISFYDYDISVLIGFTFSLAATLGMLTFLAPGGLGIREGLLVSFLTQFMFSFSEATTISILSRFWFLSIEIIIFLIGILLFIVFQKFKGINLRNIFYLFFQNRKT